ncbi:hypothetical protein IJT17_05470 [bacterium]|nr:hypothetical protein [bacterium]
MRHFFAFILLTLLLAAQSWAGEVGMVVKTPEDGDIMVNRGTEDSVRPGTHWYIYRDGKPIAELEVQLVDTYSSYTKLVSGGGVRVGDVVSDVPFAQAPKPEDFNPTPKVREFAAPSPEQDARNSIYRSMRPETQKSVEEKYQDLVSSNTKVCEFSGGNKEARRPTANLLQIGNVFTTVTSIKHLTPMLGLQTLGGVVPQEVEANTGAKEFFKGCQLKFETTWWSEDLVSAYADTMAFREGKSDPQERLMMRSALLTQKGLDRYILFHVKITNTGTGNVQLEPFHWHMFLIDGQGNRVKTERYDQILDKTLAPEQTIEGYVYFLRTDATGNDITSPEGVTIVFEDILAEREQIFFAAPRPPQANKRI